MYTETFMFDVASGEKKRARDTEKKKCKEDEKNWLEIFVTRAFEN